MMDRLCRNHKLLFICCISDRAPAHSVFAAPSGQCILTHFDVYLEPVLLKSRKERKILAICCGKALSASNEVLVGLLNNA